MATSGRLYPQKSDMDTNNSYNGAPAPPYTPLHQEPAPAPVVLNAPTVSVATGMGMGNYNPPVGPDSTELVCPQCRCRIKTKVRHRSTAKTHIACLLLSWTLCCCCLPYCMDSCRNANHFCPMCGAFIGTYQS